MDSPVDTVESWLSDPDNARFVLAIAGVKAAEREERQIDDTGAGAIIVSVQVGGVPASEPVDVIDGQSWVVE